MFRPPTRNSAPVDALEESIQVCTVSTGKVETELQGGRQVQKRRSKPEVTYEAPIRPVPISPIVPSAKLVPAESIVVKETEPAPVGSIRASWSLGAA